MSTTNTELEPIELLSPEDVARMQAQAGGGSGKLTMAMLIKARDMLNAAPVPKTGRIIVNEESFAAYLETGGFLAEEHSGVQTPSAIH